MPVLLPVPHCAGALHGIAPEASSGCWCNPRAETENRLIFGSQSRDLLEPVGDSCVPLDLN